MHRNDESSSVFSRAESSGNSTTCHKKYTATELVCEKAGAVVEVHSEYILLGHDGEEVRTVVDGLTPLEPNSRTDVILNGNGFFIKHEGYYYIVCPSHLVLMPPSLTSICNRYPFINSDQETLQLGKIKDMMVRASRILVSVFNVNKSGNGFVYEADLVGVDGAGDTAVLRINHKREFNRCSPEIKSCHPFFELGSSRACKTGQKVFLMGDVAGNSQQRQIYNSSSSVIEGLIANHRYVDYAGMVLPECLLISTGIYANTSGLPVINEYGKVVAMQTTDQSLEYNAIGSDGFYGETGFVSGPTEFFMRPVISELIKGTSAKKYNPKLSIVCDGAGSYVKYIKAYAGIAYNVFSGYDYDITQDYTSTGSPSQSSLPRIRLTTPKSGNGDFVNTPSCKWLAGVKVLGLAGVNQDDTVGINNGYYYVPGGDPSIGSFLPSLPKSAFLSRILPGDMITHIRPLTQRKAFVLGTLGDQVAPSLVTWKLSKEDQIELVYRRGGNALNNENNSDTEDYSNTYTVVSCLENFPDLMDYPWYAVKIFPLLAERGWTFVPGQISDPQFPARSGVSAYFHPAF